MTKPTLYFGKARDAPGKQIYVVYHEMFEAGGAARIGRGFTLERLAGYIEGATACTASKNLGLQNGIPSNYQKSFLGKRIEKLPVSVLKRALRGSDVLSEYPSLVKTA